MTPDLFISIETHLLANRLESHGLMDTTLREMNRDELCILVQATADCTHGYSLPYWRTGSHERTPIVPFNAPARYKFWLHENERNVLSHVLAMLQATPEEHRKYLGIERLTCLESKENISIEACMECQLRKNCAAYQ